MHYTGNFVSYAATDIPRRRTSVFSVKKDLFPDKPSLILFPFYFHHHPAAASFRRKECQTVFRAVR